MFNTQDTPPREEGKEQPRHNKVFSVLRRLRRKIGLQSRLKEIHFKAGEWTEAYGGPTELRESKMGRRLVAAAVKTRAPRETSHLTQTAEQKSKSDRIKSQYYVERERAKIRHERGELSTDELDSHLRDLYTKHKAAQAGVVGSQRVYAKPKPGVGYGDVGAFRSAVIQNETEAGIPRAKQYHEQRQALEKIRDSELEDAKRNPLNYLESMRAERRRGKRVKGREKLAKLPKMAAIPHGTTPEQTAQLTGEYQKKVHQQAMSTVNTRHTRRLNKVAEELYPHTEMVSHRHNVRMAMAGSVAAGDPRLEKFLRRTNWPTSTSDPTSGLGTRAIMHAQESALKAEAGGAPRAVPEHTPLLRHGKFASQVRARVEPEGVTPGVVVPMVHEEVNPLVIRRKGVQLTPAKESVRQAYSSFIGETRKRLGAETEKRVMRMQHVHGPALAKALENRATEHLRGMGHSDVDIRSITYKAIHHGKTGILGSPGPLSGDDLRSAAHAIGVAPGEAEKFRSHYDRLTKYYPSTPGRREVAKHLLRSGSIFKEAEQQVASVATPELTSRAARYIGGKIPALGRGMLGAKTGAEHIAKTYPSLVKSGKLGAGIAVAGAAGYALNKYLRRREKETQFKEKDNTLAHDIAIGGIEGAGGYYTTEKLIKDYIKPETAGGKLATAGIVGGIATGTIGYGLNRFLRSFKKKQQQKQQLAMAMKGRIIHFDSEGYNAPYPPTQKRRLTVAQDKYRKAVREREIERKEANLAKSTLAGAALGGLVRGKVGAGIGAASGIVSSAALTLRNRRTRDPFGEETIAAKRVERLPYQVPGLAAAGIVGHKLYKRLHKFAAQDDDQQWFKGRKWKREALPRRWEETETKIKRGGRLLRDIGQAARGEPLEDPRGRQRTPEWKKPWVTSALAGLAFTGIVARGKLVKTPEWRRMVTGGIGGRQASILKSKIYNPQAGKELSQISLVGKRAVGSERFGYPLGSVKRLPANVHRSVRGAQRDIKKAWTNYGAKVKAKQELKDLATSQATKEAAARAEHERIKDITEPKKYLSDKNKLIKFAEHVPDWDIRDPRGRSARIYAPGHQKRQRRHKKWYEKKENRDLLTGAGLVGAGAGGYGISSFLHKPAVPEAGAPPQPPDIWAAGVKASAKKRAEEGLAKKTAQQIAAKETKQIASWVPRRIWRMSALLDDLINFSSITYHETEADIHKRKAGVHEQKAGAALALSGYAAAAGTGAVGTPLIREPAVRGIRKAGAYIESKGPFTWSRGQGAVFGMPGGAAGRTGRFIQRHPRTIFAGAAYAPAAGLVAAYGAHKLGVWRQKRLASEEQKSAQVLRRERNARLRANQ